MAVLPPWRNRGVGARLLDCALKSACDRGLQRVFLNAQTQASDLYARAGFEPVGDVFSEAGIPHIRMERLCRSLADMQ
jgi:predicted GNAT family N-acyltransferase